jgi:Flp pilus assembly protein CpaB
MARTVADNVEILAIGRRYGHQNSPPPAADGQPQPDTGNPRNVTLLVTPQQAHVVELAFKMGNPRFVLRGSSDTKPTPNTGITLADLRTQSSEMGAQERLLVGQHTYGAGPTTRSSDDFWSVRVIRATAESTVNLPMEPQEKMEQPTVVKPQTSSPPGVVQNETAPATGR